MNNVAVQVNVFAEPSSRISPFEIAGTNLNEIKTLSASSDIVVAGSYCKVILELSSPEVVASVLVQGKSNTLTINGGQAKIKILGRGNTINAINSQVLSEDVSGNSNCVRQAA
jgi:hypothetical protein